MRRLLWMALVLPAVAQIPDSKWRLTKAPAGLPAGKAMLTFADGRVGFAGCNSHSGTFQLVGKSLRTAEMIGTMKACLEGKLMELDTQMVKTLQSATVDMKKDRLRLLGADGSRWEFAREPQPSAAAVTKFIHAAALKDCSGVGPARCLQVTESLNEPWKLHYGPILGFEYVPGIQYRLRIKEDKAAGKVPADGSTLVWYLDQVMEQKVIDEAAVKAHLDAAEARERGTKPKKKPKAATPGL
jgi:hypothetical protein